MASAALCCAAWLRSREGWLLAAFAVLLPAVIATKREGLLLAQRYPADFDGIFSRVPVIHWTGLQHAGPRFGVTQTGEGWLPPALVARIHEGVLEACDALDGLKVTIAGED